MIGAVLSIVIVTAGAWLAVTVSWRASLAISAVTGALTGWTLLAALLHSLVTVVA